MCGKQFGNLNLNLGGVVLADSNTWTPRLLSILRIITGFLFMAHGMQKLLGYPPSAQGGGGGGSLPTLMLVAGILELGGGLLILIGLFTRPVAFILAGMMAVAYWMAHGSQMFKNPSAFWPIVNQGELAVIYCFVFLFFAFAGGGAWSADNALRRR
jgi:putative oxidoreductase